MSLAKTNTITFTLPGRPPAYLTLDGEWQMSAGMKPNVNSFTVSGPELEKLGDDLTLEGSLRFTFETDPDKPDGPRWDKMGIVSVEPIEAGEILPNLGKVVIAKWRLSLADVRRDFEGYRGGQLYSGEINAQPFDDATGKDKNGQTLVNNKELVDACLKAMRLGITAPAALSATGHFYDLKWFGSHAPTELAKILDELGWTLIVRQDGTCKVVKIGEGEFEVPSNAAMVEGGFVLPRVDRRGKTVVFCSAPTPALNTITVSGFGQDKWELVAPDTDGRWRTLDKLKMLGGRDPAAVVRGGFVDVAEQWREIARTHLYRCIRLSEKKYPRATILRLVEQRGDYASNLEISGRVAVRNAEGQWVTPSDNVRLHVVALFAPDGSGTIVRVREVLGNVGAGGGGGDPDADFTPLTDYELTGRITIEASEADPAGAAPGAPADAPKTRTTYFFSGWTSGVGVGGALQRVADGDVRGAVGEPDVLVVSRPEMRLLQVDGVDQNRDDLDAACKLLAPRFVRGSGDPAKQHVFVGFASLNCSGRVAAIRYKQSPPLTTVDELTWWMPHATYLKANKEAKGEGTAGGSGGGAPAQAFPNQGRTEAERIGLGMASSQQPANIVQPGEFQPSAPAEMLVSVYKVDGTAGAAGTGGKYYGHPLSGKTTVTEAGNLAMPEGLASGAEDVLILNLLEDRKATHWMLYTRVHMCRIIGRLPAAADGTPGRRVGVIEVPNPCETFVCSLSNASGDNPNYAYDWKNLQGDLLASGQAPQEGRMGWKVTAPASRGLGYFDNEGNFKALVAFETPQTKSCVAGGGA